MVAVSKTEETRRIWGGQAPPQHHCNMGSSQLFWSAPAERSGDGALDWACRRIFRQSKAVSRCACHRTPN